MKLLPYLLYLLLIAMFEVVLRDVTAVFGVGIRMASLTVLLVALYKSETVALWYGFAAGLVLGAEMPSLIGWHGLVLAVIGLVGHSVRERLNLDSFYSRLLFILGGVLLHNLLLAVVIGPDGFFYQLLTDILPSAVYTTIAAWIFLLFKDGVITYQRVKSIF